MRKKPRKEEIDFLSVASHQLRTPLTMMKGYLSMMLEGSFGRITQPKLKAALAAVYQANERLVRLVDNLLTVSRVEGALKLDLASTDIADLAAEAVFEMKNKAAAKQLALTVQVPGEGLSLHIDPLMIRQVLMNLIDNAIKYTARGGITVRVERAGPGARLTVSDTGPGLAPKQLKGLFGKFERRDVRDSAEEGFGLGLYVCKLIVLAHKGTIQAEKNKPNGLRVEVELPL